MSWWQYVERVADTRRQRDIAERTHIDATNISRWKSGQNPRPDMVAQFARAYRRPVLEAFIAAGFLTADEAGEIPSTPPSFDDITDEQLIAELTRRLARAGTVASIDRRSRMLQQAQPVEEAAGSTDARSDEQDWEPR